MAMLQRPGLWSPSAVYEAVHAFTRDMARKGLIPSERVRSGTSVLRVFPATYKGQPTNATDAHTIFGGSKKDTNRWTGLQADGTPGVGGLYTSLHPDARDNELLYYSREYQYMRLGPAAPDVKTALQTKRAFEFRVKSDLEVAYFDLQDEKQARNFVKDMERDRGVQAALRTSGRVSVLQVHLTDDYSVDRALGNAAGEAGVVQGLVAPTARDETIKLTGPGTPTRTWLFTAPTTYPSPGWR